MAMGLLSFFFIQVVTSALTSEKSFSDLLHIQQQACPLQNQPGLTNNPPNACCGFCSMDSRCHGGNSCCLQVFDDIQETHYLGLLTDRLVGCFRPELITGETSTLWRPESSTAIEMFFTCNDETQEFEASSYITQQFCENPKLGYTLDKHVPISMRIGQVANVYRNRFCVLCNTKVDYHSYYPWSIDIRCGKKIVLSQRGENILSNAEAAGCNIFFIPPDVDLVYQQCHLLPHYRISRCNVTGLWVEFDSAIEDACHSFTDPFNQTYKNYFCYLCNTDNPIPVGQGSCKDPHASPQELKPPFPYTMSLDVVLQNERDGLLNCDIETQFTDLKLNVCRDLKCDFLPYQENCLPKKPTDTDNCFVLFVKLTFGSRKLLYESDLENSTFLEAVKSSVSALVKRQVFEEMRLYKMVSYHKDKMTNVVNYLVVRLGLNYGGYFSLNEYLLTHLEDNFCYIRNSQDRKTYFRIPLCELAKFAYVSTEMETLIVPNREDMSVDTLKAFDIEPAGSKSLYCEGKSVRFISKLDFCVHIDLKQTELAMSIVNSFLIIKVSSKDFVFSQWEYKKNGDIISLCLEDYLAVYKNIDTLAGTTIHSSVPHQADHRSHKYLVLMIILILALRL